MKTVINSFKMMVLTLTAAFTLSFTTVTLAGKDPKDGNAAELLYIGRDANLPIFRLVLNNSSAEYIITVREANGGVIFSEKLKTGTASRTYKLDSENADEINGTSFEVVNKTTKETTIYKIKNLSKTVENELIIAKL